MLNLEDSMECSHSVRKDGKIKSSLGCLARLFPFDEGSLLFFRSVLALFPVKP